MDSGDRVSLGVVRRRAVRGVAVLTGRMFVIQPVNLAGNFFLTVFLGIAQYGVWWIIQSIRGFLGYFSDIGLAAALIQKKDALTSDDLRTTFTVQQALVLLLVFVLFAGSSLIQRFYDLSQEGVWLLYAVGISFFLSSLKTIPSVLLERRLEFSKLVVPQVAEVFVFNVVAVYFAWIGYGVLSFAIATLLSSFVGLVLIYILQPWMPGFAMSREALRGLLRFGVPYQANTFVAVFKDSGITLALGGILGPAGVGLWAWAKMWSEAPLRFFVDNVVKVTFPAFSRMQEHKLELGSAVSRSLFFVALLVFPALVGLVLVAPLLTELVPRYEKWQPALFALGLFAVASSWSAVTTPLTNLLNSIGKIAVHFKLMIMWTVLTWVLVPLFAYLYGVDGASLGMMLVGVSSVVAIVIVRKYVAFDFWGSVKMPLFASMGMGLVVWLVRSVLPNSLMSVLLLLFVGPVVYVVLIRVLVGSQVCADVQRLIKIARKG